MSIEVRCANGHRLTVGEEHAGHVGRCPLCQVRVPVPKPRVSLSDDAIADLLGPPSETPQARPISVEAETPSSVYRLSAAEMLAARGVKLCPKCHHEVKVCYTICTHCKTYFTDKTEVNRRLSHD